MKISAQLTMILAVIFAVACFGVAIQGLTSLSEITDPVVLSDSKGFAWFWAFLGAICVAMGLVSWWIVKTGKDEH
jgi:hypothetical protein